MSVHDIIAKLLTPDSATVQEGSKQLADVLKLPNAIAELCQVMGTADTPQVRQYAAVILRKKLTKLGVYVISIVSGVAGDQLIPHLLQMLPFLSRTLDDLSSPAAFYTIQSLTNFAPFVGQEHMDAYQKLLPKVIDAVHLLITQDEDKASQAMDIFDILAECEYIVKNKLHDPIVNTIFNMLCEKGDEDDSAGFLGGSEGEGNSPVHAAAQALDSCAIHLPPDKLLPVLMQRMEIALKSGNEFQMKGIYLALAMVAEGCADTLMHKHLNQLLLCICHGIRSESQVVRNSALFALGQFAEHLQPDISKFHGELLPVLFQYLSQVCGIITQGGKDPPGVDRMFYALEVFCEHLEEELLPHLSSLMECLFAILATPCSVHMKELSISAIGATANAAKENMSPYFEQIVEHLKGYLTQENNSETMTLQVQSLDTLGQLARNMGAEHFHGYADDCISLGLSLLDNSDDPDVRKTTYLLFASLASVVKNALAPHLPKLMDYILRSLKSTEGVVVHLNDEGNGLPATVEGLSGTDSEDEIDLEKTNEADDEDDSDLAGFSVENAYLEEKEDTCVALREIASHCGECFFTYIEEAAEEVFKLLNFPSEDVKQAAVGTMGQFLISLSKNNTVQSQEQFNKYVVLLSPKLSELVCTCEDRPVVLACLETYAELLKEVGVPIIEKEGHLDSIINCVRKVMTKKTVCQDMADEAESDDEGEAEQDEMLVEYAGEIVPHLGKALGHEQFSVYFTQLFPLFLNKTKKSCSEAERSFAIGTVSEMIEPLGPATERFVPQLLPLFLQVAKDSDDEVRSNAIYGLGVLGQYGGKLVLDNYATILTTLSEILSKENFPRALDNICGALARLIVTDVNKVPMQQVFPALLNYLPLREDFEENLTIFTCFLVLYRQKNPYLGEKLPHIMRLAAIAYSTKQADDNSNSVIKELLLSIHSDMHDQFSSLLQSLEPELSAKVKMAIEAVK